ncbi:hypothetical protein MAP00_004869 [Monascus purpureus]|nr:hypothetical protein MAP00_004869 [Monascus purpureus]
MEQATIFSMKSPNLTNFIFPPSSFSTPTFTNPSCLCFVLSVTKCTDQDSDQLLHPCFGFQCYWSLFPLPGRVHPIDLCATCLQALESYNQQLQSYPASSILRTCKPSFKSFGATEKKLSKTNITVHGILTDS